MTLDRRRLVSTVLVWGIAALGVSVATVAAFRSAGPDYLQFWTIGRAMPVQSYDELHGRELTAGPVAGRAMARAAAVGPDELYLTATPLYYACFAIVSGADFLRSLRLFQLASLVVFLGGLTIALRKWGYSREGVAFCLGTCTLLCVPFHHDTAQANVSRLYAGGVCTVLWLVTARSFVARTAGAQALLALLVLFKPLSLLAFPALMAVRIAGRRWTHVIYETGGFAGGALLGVWFPSLALGVPVRLWSDFWRIQTGYVEGGDYRQVGDASVVEHVATVAPLSGPAVVAITVVVVATVTATVTLAARRVTRKGSLNANREQESEEATLAALLGSTGVLLLSPLVWPHYYLLAVVLALFLLRNFGSDRPTRGPRSVVLAVSLTLLCGLPVRAFQVVFRGAADTVSVEAGQFALGAMLACCVAVLDLARRTTWMMASRPARETAAPS
jgi:hypothetical protein